MSVMKLWGSPNLQEDAANAAPEDAQTAAGVFGPSAEAPEEQEPPTGAVAQASERDLKSVPASPDETAGTLGSEIPAATVGATPGRQTDEASSSAPSSGPGGETPVPGIVALPETGGIGLGASLLAVVLLIGGGAASVRVLR